MHSANFALAGLCCITVFLPRHVNLLLNKASHCLDNEVSMCQQALHDTCWLLFLRLMLPDTWSGLGACPITCSSFKCCAVSCLLFLFSRMLLSGMLLSLSIWRIPLYPPRHQFTCLPLEKPFQASHGFPVWTLLLLRGSSTLPSTSFLRSYVHMSAG